MPKLPEEKRRDSDYIADMIEFGEKAISYCKNITKEELEKDSRTLFATTYCIQCVGEASVHLSDETKVKITSVPWKEIRGMRNILVHAYHNADADVIYYTATSELPALIKSIKNFITQNS
jgi:uncharacterized protein with HEPN domain|tara:strand:+ start:323 stop:682 length:360 start_codon:yes stop_codon:yes gene_type:complete